jgi:PEP-CTERM motif
MLRKALILGEFDMRSMILAAAFLAATAIPGAAGMLGIEIFDNGTLIDQLSGITTGTALLTTSDAAFRDIQVNVEGSPVLPLADLSSTSLDASAASGFSGTHVLTVDVFQTNVSGRGPTQSTFTVNGLIGAPGPTTENSFEGGSATSLGTLLATHTFPVGLTNGAAGPIAAAAGAFNADALQYSIAFTAPNQSFGGSSQVLTSVPEPSTWAMVAIGFGVMGLIGFRRRATMGVA